MDAFTLFEKNNLAGASPRKVAGLCVWREAQGEKDLARRGVAHSIANRAADPGWWGHDVVSVVLKPFQYSSFNTNDPGHNKWPDTTDTSWQDCLSVVDLVLAGMDADPTSGATSYFDISIDGHPPKWATDGEFEFTVQLGRLKFFRRTRDGQQF